MWPWEHVAVAYITWSLLAHTILRRPPTGAEALVVALASVVPDLIDKPLGWEFGIFASGYGAAHSIFIAVPVLLGLFVLTRAFGSGGIGAAFGVGYLTHLPGDLLVGFLAYGYVPLARVLWPVRTVETDYPGGFSGTLQEYLFAYVGAFLDGDIGTAAIVGSLAFIACVGVWLYDGAPGVREVFAVIAR